MLGDTPIDTITVAYVAGLAATMHAGRLACESIRKTRATLDLHDRKIDELISSPHRRSLLLYRHAGVPWLAGDAHAGPRGVTAAPGVPVQLSTRLPASKTSIPRGETGGPLTYRSRREVKAHGDLATAGDRLGDIRSAHPAESRVPPIRPVVWKPAAPSEVRSRGL